MPALTHSLTLHPTANSKGQRRWLPTCSCGWVGVNARSESRATNVWTVTHFERQPRHCPTPSKKRFKTQATAEAEMELFWRTAGRGKTMPVRVYECECGGWHMTSKPLRGR